MEEGECSRKIGGRKSRKKDEPDGNRVGVSFCGRSFLLQYYCIDCKRRHATMSTGRERERERERVYNKFVHIYIYIYIYIEIYRERERERVYNKFVHIYIYIYIYIEI